MRQGRLTFWCALPFTQALERFSQGWSPGEKSTKVLLLERMPQHTNVDVKGVDRCRKLNLGPYKHVCEHTLHSKEVLLCSQRRHKVELAHFFWISWAEQAFSAPVSQGGRLAPLPIAILISSTENIEPMYHKWHGRVTLHYPCSIPAVQQALKGPTVNPEVALDHSW